MTHDNHHNVPDRLDRAVAALRDTPVPAGPPPSVTASTVEALQMALNSSELAPLRERRQKMFRLMRTSSLAAAAALLLVLGAWLLLMHATAPLAFAQVVENVKKAKSVTFVTRIPTIIQGTKRSMLEQKHYIQGDSYRMELPGNQEGAKVPPDAPPILLAIIADGNRKQGLEIDFMHKTAKRIQSDDKTWQEMTKTLANPIEQLRQLKSDDAERLGEEELEGHKTQVYRLKSRNLFMGMQLGKGEIAKLWVDAKSGLPVRIAIEPAPDSKEPSPLFVFEQFHWNETLDPKLFELKAPEGFRVEEK